MSDLLQGVAGLAALPFHQRLPQRPLRVHLSAQLTDVICKGHGIRAGNGGTRSFSPAQQAGRASTMFPLPQRSHPEPAEPPRRDGGRGGTFVQQCRGQGCEVTKLKGKGVTGSGRLWGAKGPDLLDGITKQFQPPRRDREHQCWWWRAENKTNHRFWGKSLLLPFKPLGKHHTQQSRAGLSSGMREEIFPSPR